MSRVFIKFRAAKDFDSIIFDGIGISVFDLKREIMREKKLEFADDKQVVPKNASIIVRRLPAPKNGKGTAQRYVVDTTSPAIDPTTMTSSSQSSTAPLQLPEKILSPLTNEPLSGETEDDRINSMLAAQAQEWEQSASDPSKAASGSKYLGKRKFQKDQFDKRPSGPPPSSYVCYRCLIKGHWIKDCPTNGNKVFDTRVKKTTGIPKSFLKVVEQSAQQMGAGGVAKNLMINQDGQLVVLQANEEAWQRVNRNMGIGLRDMNIESLYELAPVIDELACPICSKLLREAVALPCCQTSFCDECIRQAFMDVVQKQEEFNSTHGTNDIAALHCPNCGSTSDLDLLQPNEKKRQSVTHHLEQYTRSMTSSSSVVQSKDEDIQNDNSTFTKATSSAPGSITEKPKLALSNSTAIVERSKAIIGTTSIAITERPKLAPSASITERPLIKSAMTGMTNPPAIQERPVVARRTAVNNSAIQERPKSSVSAIPGVPQMVSSIGPTAATSIVNEFEKLSKNSSEDNESLNDLDESKGSKNTDVVMSDEGRNKSQSTTPSLLTIKKSSAITERPKSQPPDGSQPSKSPTNGFVQGIKGGTSMPLPVSKVETGSVSVMQNINQPGANMQAQMNVDSAMGMPIGMPMGLMPPHMMNMGVSMGMGWNMPPAIHSNYMGRAVGGRGAPRGRGGRLPHANFNPMMFSSSQAFMNPQQQMMAVMMMQRNQMSAMQMTSRQQQARQQQQQQQQQQPASASLNSKSESSDTKKNDTSQVKDDLAKKRKRSSDSEIMDLDKKLSGNSNGSELAKADSNDDLEADRHPLHHPSHHHEQSRHQKSRNITNLSKDKKVLQSSPPPPKRRRPVNEESRTRDHSSFENDSSISKSDPTSISPEMTRKDTRSSQSRSKTSQLTPPPQILSQSSRRKTDRNSELREGRRQQFSPQPASSSSRTSLSSEQRLSSREHVDRDRNRMRDQDRDRNRDRDQDRDRDRRSDGRRSNIREVSSKDDQRHGRQTRSSTDRYRNDNQDQDSRWDRRSHADPDTSSSKIRNRPRRLSEREQQKTAAMSTNHPVYEAPNYSDGADDDNIISTIHNKDKDDTSYNNLIDQSLGSSNSSLVDFGDDRKKASNSRYK